MLKFWVCCQRQERFWKKCMEIFPGMMLKLFPLTKMYVIMNQGLLYAKYEKPIIM